MRSFVIPFIRDTLGKPLFTTRQRSKEDDQLLNNQQTKHKIPNKKDTFESPYIISKENLPVHLLTAHPYYILEENLPGV